MAATTLLTIDDFERLPAELAENHELVDGALVDVSGNNPKHIELRDYLIELLRPIVRRAKLGKVYSEQEYDFNGNAHGPDVSFFGPAKLPLLDLEKRVQRFVPDLAIEIASPSDSYEGLLHKKNRYLNAGVSEVWVISPTQREITIWAPGARTLRGSEVVSTPLIPGFSITVEELFRDI